MQINRKIINKPINNERVLLHACCAGCSGEIIEALSYSDIKFAIYFYNPNINTKEEYKKVKAYGISAGIADYQLDFSPQAK